MNQPSKPRSSAERKQQLLAEGAVYRAEILASKQQVSDSLRVESLAKVAAGVAARGAIAAWQGRGSVLGAGLPALLPMVARYVTQFADKKHFKPIVKGTLVAGAVAATVALFRKRKNRQKSTSAAED